ALESGKQKKPQQVK
uniref:Chaperone, TCP1-related n=1 Tax=Avena sativa TaxID=4498 RepID=Q7M1G5_AVESA